MDREGSLEKQFYDSHHIIRNLEGQISVEDLAGEIISVVNDMISNIAKQ